MIERRLRESADAVFPRTPRVTPAVVVRLPPRPDAAGVPIPRRVLAVAVALLALAGTAVAARGLDLVGGVRIERTERLPLVDYTFPPFGREVSREEAAAAARFTLLLPEILRAPDWMLVDRDPGGAPVVTAVWGRIEGGRLVLTQWAADSILFEKMIGYQAVAEFVDVDGAPGIWIEGEDHAVFYNGVAGASARVEGHLSGNTLIWQRGPVSYRLEAAVSRDRALALARSLRPAR